MEPVITKDGTLTYFNEQFGEHYHCMAGALAEAEIKHLEPVKEYIRDGCVILDFCFGLGYNTIVALRYAREIGVKNISVIALESDIEIIKKIQTLSLPSEYKDLQDAFAQLSFERKISIGGFTLELLLGDAASTINNIALSPTIVFFDPFSPKKHPELWSQEIFSKLFSIMSSKSILTTYSCARHVRDKLSAAGFRVSDGPVFGRKSASTLALKD